MKNASNTYIKSLFLGYIVLHSVISIHGQTTISFAGLDWYVKSGFYGPGPNQWSNSPQSVWVDNEGQLHLKMRKINNTWYCAEVYSQQSFGYGEYLFHLASHVENYDKNIVTGLFTYENDSREIDIEFSRWGATSNAAGWYTVQPPPYNPNNHQNFALNLSGDYSTHKFIWNNENIHFQSYHGHYDTLPAPAFLIKEWTYTAANNPPVGNERLHINFWLMSGLPPSNQQEAELIIKSVSVPNQQSTSLVVPATVQHLNIFPNPNSGEFSLEMEVKNEQNLVIKLTNSLGQTIYVEQLKHYQGKYHKTIGSMQLPKGVYLLQISDDIGQQVKQKMVIN